MKIKNLDKFQFLKQVANYVTHPTEWIYLGDKPAIINFYNSTSVSCSKLVPILEELALSYIDQVYIYKIDAEQEKELTEVFGVRSFPSLLFIPMIGGLQMMQTIMSKQEIEEAIENVLLKKTDVK